MRATLTAILSLVWHLLYIFIISLAIMLFPSERNREGTKKVSLSLRPGTALSCRLCSLFAHFLAALSSHCILIAVSFLLFSSFISLTGIFGLGTTRTRSHALGYINNNKNVHSCDFGNDVFSCSNDEMKMSTTTSVISSKTEHK